MSAKKSPFNYLVIIPFVLMACLLTACGDGLILAGGSSNVAGFEKDGNTLISFSLAENSSMDDVKIVIKGNIVDASQYTFSVESSNQALLKDSNIVLAGSGKFRTLTITPEPDQTGEATLTGTITNTLTNESITGSVVMKVEGDLIDQSQTVYKFLTLNLPTYAAVGQTFIPTASELNFVDLRLADSTTANVGDVIYVKIRESNHLGNLLATSRKIYLEDCFNLPDKEPGCNTASVSSVEVRFTFEQMVSLVPGNTYFIEVLQTMVGTAPHQPYHAVVFEDANSYPNGELYKSGAPYTGRDMWFKTGVTNLEYWYADTDGDSHGDPTLQTTAYEHQGSGHIPAGYVDTATDCDDADNNNFFLNVEVVDSKDNDCDSVIDE